jgi:hypothetical protein
LLRAVLFTGRSSIVCTYLGHRLLNRRPVFFPLLSHCNFEAVVGPHTPTSVFFFLCFIFLLDRRFSPSFINTLSLFTYLLTHFHRHHRPCGVCVCAS